MAILNGGYNGDTPDGDQPDDTAPYVLTEFQTEYLTRHTDQEHEDDGAIGQSIAQNQMSVSERISALDHTTIPHHVHNDT